ncbi:hypothetical protein U9M48_033268 [Paspalum notatum var. saurae]|uniref:LanC-like protein 2 n=1 Tax=Paspalum notatum var. saurae TaxID=547442 RepID=A0AAQ3U6H8_PASNO
MAVSGSTALPNYDSSEFHLAADVLPDFHREAGMAMADRFFPNDMPGYVEETAASPMATELCSSSFLHTLLSLPYPALADHFLRAAHQLKQKATDCTTPPSITGFTRSSVRVLIIVGVLRRLRAFLVTGDHADLATCAEIVAACDAASAGEESVTSICGAVVARHAGDEVVLSRYLSSFKQEMIMREIIEDGRRLSTESCPLMYEWYGEKYWGAAHGLAGIVHVLLDMDLEENKREYVKGTLWYMIQNRFPSGNYPCTEEDNYDCLVHWCHGAPGISLTLTKASEVFP